MKARLNRDEQGFSKIPESNGRPDLYPNSGHVRRQPSDLIQNEIEHPLMNLQNFKPALDEFLKYGPSSDVEKVKNLAAEIAAMNSRLDPAQISTQIDHSYGIASQNKPYQHPTINNTSSSLFPQQLGPQSFSLSRDTLGFSINSFSSLVDFGELDANKARNESSWQQSINQLMPAPGDPEKFHKEYKVYESNDTKRVTSNEWTIDYSMNSQTFTPTNEASSELTNNVVTYVQLNEMDHDYNMQSEPTPRMPRRNPFHSDDYNRQMSVDIKTASIGIDNEGRLGSYELISTNLQMQQSPHLPHVNLNWDPDPLPPNCYRVDAIPSNANTDYQHHMNPVDTFVPMNSRGDYQQHPRDNQTYHHFGQSLGHSYPSNLQHQHPEQHNQHQMQHSPMSQSQSPVSGRPHGLKNPTDLTLTQAMSCTSGDSNEIAPFEITQGDVLLERGGKGNHHKGSRYYRRLINERRESYQELPEASRAEKMAISLSVVMSVKATGARFIHKKKGKYIIMSDREARNKISQALREKKERVMLDA